jgi:hypothetical protein
MAEPKVKAIRLNIELSEPQYAMLMDCMQTTETFYRREATAMASENTQYANKIKYLGDMISKLKELVYE